MLNFSTLEYTNDDINSFLWKMHINGVVSLLSTVLAIYMIFCKSSNSMKIYKWFLLNIVVFIFWFEIYLTVLFIPFPIFPIPGFCAIGPLRNFGWYWGAHVSLFVMTEFLGVCGMSVNLAAGFRWAAVCDKTDWFTKPLNCVLLFTSQFLYSLPTFISGLLAVEERDLAVRNMLEKYPKMEKFFFENTCFIIPLDNNPKLYICLGIILVELSFIAIASTFINFKSYSALMSRRSSMSGKVYAMHMQFIWAIGVQFAVPTIMINFPFVLYVAFLLLQSEAGIGFSQFMFIGITTHSLVNTIIMISMTAPYKKAVFSWLDILRGNLAAKKESTQTTAVFQMRTITIRSSQI